MSSITGKKILITGASGFIGSHLTEELLKKGAKVKALAHYNSFNFWGWLEDIPKNKNLEIISGDIRDPYLCINLTKNIDLIFHLAALIAIPYSYIAVESYFETNVKGTLNICQAARKNGNIRLIHTSTSEVYGTAKYVPIDENHPKQPQSPYSASKIGADAIAKCFFNTYGLPVTIARPFNTYGPRQSARAIIPSIIIQISSGKIEVETGNLNPTRDLNYVEDICRGFLSLLENEQTIGKEINICSKNEVSMKDVADMIKNLMGAQVSFISSDQRVRPKNSEVYRLLGDNSTIKKLTGFNPQIRLEEGLRRTIQWFSAPENKKKFKAWIYNV